MKYTISRLVNGLFYAIALTTMVSCAHTGSPALINTTLVGNAIKGPLKNAEVTLVYFDDLGQEVEITASNAPVMTDVNGRYAFSFDTPRHELPANLGPGIVRTIGGTTDPDNGAAPSLEAVIPDLGAITTSSASITRHLSAASSVAAGLLKLEAANLAARPSVAATNALIKRVEIEFGIDLEDDPNLVTSTTGAMNRDIDALLALQKSAANNKAINEYVEYLTANLASTSGKLDGDMRDAKNPGMDVKATLETIGSGALAALFPGGPEELRVLRVIADKAQIENDGLDSAILTVSVHDGTGTIIPTSDTGSMNNPGSVELKIASGQAILGKEKLSKLNGDKFEFDVRLSSIWPGSVTVEATYKLENGNLVTQIVPVEVVDKKKDVTDEDPPRIVNANAISNTQVIVTFTEPLRGGLGGAEDPAFYSITAVAPPGQPAVGALVDVIEAVLIAPDYTSIRLTTQSQSGISYKLQASNLRDLAGNSFDPPSREFQGVDPSSTIFVGVPPSGADIVDSDNDGLSDSDELFGWAVTITSPNGQPVTSWVTSDPKNVDTDGDGVTDNEEKHGAINPRSADTDGDTLTDDEEWNTIFSDASSQDTDGDGVQDGFEYWTFRTSPILADTDGDQISDADEVSAGNRNPLIADLPSPDITVGSVDMQLMTTFTITDEKGVKTTEAKTSETTMTRGQNDTTSNSSENSTKITLENSQELAITARSGDSAIPVPGFEVTATAGRKQGSERGSTFTAGEESGRSSEEAFHDSLTTTSEIDARETVTREITGATIKAFVSIENAGDIPFSIRNLELSAQSQNPNDRRQVIPVASLVPQNDSLGAVNIGVIGDASRGPFVFTTAKDSVFPQQVQDLMKNPRGFLVQIANFDIIDENDNNLSFSSQEVLDRTAGITFDFGDSRQESYRVATASAHDRSTGRPLGITMERALSIIGLQRYETIRDGGNGIFESTFQDPDDKLATISSDPSNPSGTDTVEPGEVLITAGENGLIDSMVAGDDLLVQPDYVTTVIPFFATIVDGGNGFVNTKVNPSGDDVQVLAFGTVAKPGQVIISTGPDGILQTTPGPGDKIQAPLASRRLLTRLRDKEANGDTKSFWVLFLNKDRLAVDLDNRVIRAGEQYDFAYVQDKDKDGVFASEEALHGSSDQLVNTDACDYKIPSDISERVVGDNCDNLDDKVEIQEGWLVKLAGSTEFRQVYPNPNQGDSDRDRLFDDQEQACKLDPRQRDTDLDGLTDWEELSGMQIVDGFAVQMVSRDISTNEVIHEITPYLASTPVPYTDKKGKTGDLVPHGGDTVVACGNALAIKGFATDPLNPDTDGDLIPDGRELKLGINPNDKKDGPLFLDDDGDGVPNKLELDGYLITVNGIADAYRVYSNPFKVDSDDDGLPDLLERFLGSNPSPGRVNNCYDDTVICRQSGTDTDGDNIADINEYKNRGKACVTTNPGVRELCTELGSLVNDGWQDYLSKCEGATVCNSVEIETYTSGFDQFGTNLNEKDSDFDTINDPDEMKEDSVIVVNGSNVSLPVSHISGWISDPLNANSDEDDWNDGVELARKTDPRNRDTDEDGTDDHVEPGRERNPVYADKRVTITSSGFNITIADDEGTDNWVELRWWANTSLNNVNFGPQVCDHSANNRDVGFVEKACSYGAFVVTRKASSNVRIQMDGWEHDDADDEECDTVIKTFTYADAETDQNAAFTCGPDPDLAFNLDLITTVD